MLAQGAAVVSVWAQLGVGGIFAILILRLVFDFVKDRKGNGFITPGWAKDAMTRQAKMVVMLDDLHQWHKPDDHGEQTWKNSRMLKLMEDNNELQREHHVLMREHHSLMKRLLPTLEKLVTIGS